MIKGFDEGVQLLCKPAATAKVYIPSMLGYGKTNPQTGIKPFENLIFEIAIVDVKDKAPEQKPHVKCRGEKWVDIPQPKNNFGYK